MNPKDSNVYSKWIGQGLNDPEGGRIFDNNRQKVQNIQLLRSCSALAGIICYKHVTPLALLINAQRLQKCPKTTKVPKDYKSAQRLQKFLKLL